MDDNNFSGRSKFVLEYYPKNRVTVKLHYPSVLTHSLLVLLVCLLKSFKELFIEL